MDFIDEVLPSIGIGCCRICLDQEGEFYDVFADGEIEGGVRIDQILRECTSYTVEIADNISHQICRICLENAIFAYRFRRQADSSYRYLTGVLEMPQKSAIMLVEIGTQTDKSMYIQQHKQEREQLKFDDDQQQFCSTFNNNNDNNLNNNNNNNCISDISSHNQLTYENQTVGFEAMLFYDGDGDGDGDGEGNGNGVVDGDGDDVDVDDDNNDNLIPPFSSSSLTSTVTGDPSTTTTTTTTIVSSTPKPERTRTRRQYRNTKHCTITTDCKLCGAKHNCLLELRDHLMIEHMFIELTLGLQCRLCDHEYSRKDHLVRHLRNIHKVSRDREYGRIKIEEPQTITMGQCINDNEDDMGSAGTTTTTGGLTKLNKLESFSDLTTNQFNQSPNPSLSSLSSLSVSLSPHQKSTKLNKGYLHKPEFVRSGDELLNFKVKVLRTNCSQYDDPLKDASNVVKFEGNRNAIEFENIIPSEGDQDDGGDGDGDGDDDDVAANIENDYDDDDNDNLNMEDDVDGTSDVKSCLKYYEITTSYDQVAYNDNNDDDDGDNVDEDVGVDVGDNYGGDHDHDHDDDDDDDVGNTNMLYTITTPSLNLGKNHRCDICKRKFQRKFHLIRHMLVHTKVRAFSCEQCHRTFARSDQKAQHRKEGCKPLCRNPSVIKPLTKN